jgi:hypothetical protein
MSESSAVTGTSMAPGDFRLVRAAGVLRHQDILDLLDSTLAAVLVTDALSSALCDELSTRFWNSKGRRPRPDGVEGYYLGAYHFGKTFAQYMAAHDEAKQHWDELLKGLDDPVNLVLNPVREALKERSTILRPATWCGREVPFARFLSWPTQGEFLLEPHDDVGQLGDPRQADFEIQETASNVVLAVNIYPRVPQTGGLLRLWNILPDDDCRGRLGIEATGFPYPVSDLADFDHLDIPLESGSIAIINGGLIHAVTGYSTAGAVDRERLLINLFVGRLSPDTVVHWV